jgi:hypothetical protein
MATTAVDIAQHLEDTTQQTTFPTCVTRKAVTLWAAYNSSRTVEYISVVSHQTVFFSCPGYHGKTTHITRSTTMIP